MKKQMLVVLMVCSVGFAFADGAAAVCPPSYTDSTTSTVDLTGNWGYVSQVNRNGRFRARFRVYGITDTAAPVAYYWTDDPVNCSPNTSVLVPSSPKARKSCGVPSASAPDVYIGGCTIRSGTSRFTAYAHAGSYLVAIIDPNNRIAEANEQNNVVVLSRQF